MAALSQRVMNRVTEESNSITASDRKHQVGSGMRGDKTFTIRFQDDTAFNHVTGKSMSAHRYMRGEMDSIW